MTHRWSFHQGLIFVGLFVVPGKSWAAPDTFSSTPSVTDAPQLAPGRAVTTTPRVVQYWYGWQTLTADGIALSCALGGAALNSAPPAILGGATYVLGGPLVHASREHWGRAAVSLALRVGLPVAFASLASGSESCTDKNADTCGLGGAAVGALLGIALAMTIDSALLARDELPAPPVRSIALRLSPVVAIDHQRAFLGIGGAF